MLYFNELLHKLAHLNVCDTSTVLLILTCKYVVDASKSYLHRAEVYSGADAKSDGEGAWQIGL